MKMSGIKRRKRRQKKVARFIVLTGAVTVISIGCVWNFVFGKEHISSEVNRQAEKTTVNTSTVEIDNNQLEDLKSELEELISCTEGVCSIYVKDMNTDDEISINNQRMYAASLIKLFVMESCYENKEMLIENDSVYSGNEEQSYNKIEELLNNMITISDNESYNELVRMHGNDRSFVDGCEYVENYVLESGYENTGIFHTLSPSNTAPQSTSDTKNFTTVEDCGKLLEKIYNGTCVSESASEEMLQLLLEQQVINKIPSVLPEGVVSANKTGETDEVQHDAAIVYGEETDYIICIMTTGFSDSDSAVEIIQNVSQTVYYYLNGDAVTE